MRVRTMAAVGLVMGLVVGVLGWAGESPATTVAGARGPAHRAYRDRHCLGLGGWDGAPLGRGGAAWEEVETHGPLVFEPS